LYFYDWDDCWGRSIKMPQMKVAGTSSIRRTYLASSIKNQNFSDEANNTTDRDAMMTGRKIEIYDHRP
jgi:hypothetical protein